MDEILLIIGSLRDMNSSNLKEFCGKIKQFIDNTQIEEAKIICRKESRSIKINNIHLKYYNDDDITNIIVVIRDKYLRISSFGIEGYIFHKPFESIIRYKSDRYGEYSFVDTDLDCSEIENPSIDWLLSQKNVKSARKTITP